MLLIDSLYINSSGGLRLLEYLVARLNEKDIPFFLLADKRCVGLFDNCRHVRYMKASLWRRKYFYMANASLFSSVLCFGNIPAPIKLRVPVYTYFHNINLLTLTEAHSLKEKIVMWLKRGVYKFYRRNTDLWLVQTKNTASELSRHLRESLERIKLMPFFELPSVLGSLNGTRHGDDYVFVALCVPGKGHEELLQAWQLLKEKGIDKKLHLTVQKNHPFEEKIKEAQNDGVNVVNHGVVPFDQIIELYKQSKAIIYPSHNESLGLGIVEALTAGCDVIGSDLPYLHSICVPSEVFTPYSSESIANAVMQYETGQSLKSKLLIYNQLDELIELIK